MDELVLIDGNSIINRAFYGIMGSKMLMTEDGTYTNAVYGFLNILFKNIEDIKPKYLAVAFDLKAPTHRHKMYEAYKAGRKGMPDELASQMPLLKDVLRAMNISIIEKEGYEADDILGTLAKWGSSQNLDVTILTGDRDAFQLAEENIMIRIPRTKMGKTETDEFKTAQILETYGLLPIQMIEVKGLMGDSSDNIPGVPGIGEKTALSLIKEYETIDNLYKNLENGTDNLKGKLRENLTSNKELAILSRTLGTIDINAPIEKSLELLEIKEWDKSKVLEIFEKLKFNKFIERFNLRQEETSKSIEISEIACEYISEEIKINKLKEEISSNKIMYYYMNSSDSSNEELIIKKKIDSICIYSPKENVVFVIDKIQSILDMFENAEILKCGYKQKIDYILLKQAGIKPNNFMFDIEIAAYILNASITKYSLEYLAQEYLDFSVEEYSAKFGIDINRNSQINLFETPINTENKNSLGIVYSYVIYNLYNKFISKLGDINGLDLFNKIEMPLSEVLSEMQYEGMSVDKEELVDYGNELKVKLDELTKEIYSLSGEEFNINSPKQLGEILFNKLNLTTAKKNKSGYSTDVEVLEKLKSEHPVIEKILEYRQLN
ncbi:MAG: DNA polymerase I, partial [Lachnospiraceae bacterium]|nr:DNA polymerase I [Lachnospiraceae bacterium]